MNLFPIVWDNGLSVLEVGRLLQEKGIALIKAAPGDAEGRELRHIVGRLGTAEEHDRLGRVVWDIRYDALAAAQGATASLTMEPLPFHTDGAFQNPSPRFLAQYVVREDRFGGGKTLLVEVASVLRRLSADTLGILRSKHFRFYAPAEYANGIPHHDAPILFGDGLLRYRRAIIDEDAHGGAKAVLDELDAAISAVEPTALPLRSGDILLLDNARFLHARTELRDPERHLLRMRFSRPTRGPTAIGADSPSN
ncbi:MAG TPA: TauD/TfdA family dioxygenase [Pirellulales bacterium]|nr:TauD/TfdA family dioxygenase [Pirellulales bacterium]